MPGGPLSCLILRHSDMALGVLEGALDPEALCLHLRQLGHARLGRSVAQADFEGSRRIQLPSHNQMPTVSSGAVLFSQPDPLMQHFNDQIALGRVPQSLPPPLRGGLFLDPLAHLDGLRVAVVAHS